MKNLEKGTIKYCAIEGLAVAVFSIILYPLFDFLFCKFITNSEFHYSIINHIIDPIIFGFVFAIITWLVTRKKK